MSCTRIFTKKDCGLFICDVGMRGYFHRGDHIKLVDVQQDGQVLVVTNQKGVIAEVSPSYFRKHLTRLSVWKGNDGMVLLVIGDPREYEDTDIRLFDRIGNEIAHWVQNWTKFDDSGCKCDYGSFAPWSEKFLIDIEDAGCSDIPENITLFGKFRHHRVKEHEW